MIAHLQKGFPGGASGEDLTAYIGDVRDAAFDPWVRQIPVGGRGHPVQYSCLEKPMDGGGWWAAVHGVAKSWAWLRQLGTHLQKSAVCYSVAFIENKHILERFLGYRKIEQKV